MQNEKCLLFEAASAAFFIWNNQNIRPNRLIDVEVDENEEASAVRNQEAGRPVSSCFNPFPSGCDNQGMLCLSVRIRLYADVLYGESNSRINQPR